ncbi:MAG: VanZ family protein [Micromonosporaceae bacterium]
MRSDRLCEAGILFGTVPWLALMLRSGRAGTAGGEPVQPVPLADLWVLAQGPVGELAVQVAANLAAFAAFGFFAPVRFAALASLPRLLLVAAAGSLAVEVVQWALFTGRVTSVDDVLLNAAGAGLAALCSRRWWARWRGRHRGGAPAAAPSTR